MLARGALCARLGARAARPLSALSTSRRAFHRSAALRNEAASAPRSEKVERLTGEIASLTLLEAAELTESLKERLGIKDVMMAAPMGASAPAAPVAAAAAPAAAEPVVEKTEFTVILQSFDAAAKIKLIKEVRALTGLGLKEAKEAVEGAPKALKEAVKKAEAEDIKAKLEAAGGKILKTGACVSSDFAPPPRRASESHPPRSKADMATKAHAVPLAQFLGATKGRDDDLPSASATRDDQPAGTKYIVEWNGDGPLPLPPDVVKANVEKTVFTASNRLHTRPPASLDEFKAKVIDLVREYFDSADVMEVVRQLDELQSPRHHDQLVRRAIVLSLERSDREREMAAVLISSLHVRRIISSAQVFDAFIVLLETAADILLDNPRADGMLAHFLADAVLDGCLTPTFILEPPPLSVRLTQQQVDVAKRVLADAARRLHEGTAMAAPSEAMHVPLKEVKLRIESLIAEYLQASDVSEVSRRLREGQVHLPLRHEVVKRGVRVALQRGPEECESVSRLLSALYGQTLPAAEIARGFEALIDEASDLLIDVPATPLLLGNFLARAVSDEVLAASFVEHALRTKPADDVGAAALKRAKALLAIGHNSHRMARIWGPRAMAATAPVGEVKAMFQDVVDEFFVSKDADEAQRALDELGVPAYHHEFAKKLLRRALEGSAGDREGAIRLLAQLTAGENATVARESVAQGFERLREALDDLRLDTPSAPQLLAELRASARANDVVSA